MYVRCARCTAGLSVLGLVHSSRQKVGVKTEATNSLKLLVYVNFECTKCWPCRVPRVKLYWQGCNYTNLHRGFHSCCPSEISSANGHILCGPRNMKCYWYISAHLYYVSRNRGSLTCSTWCTEKADKKSYSFSSNQRGVNKDVGSLVHVCRSR